MNDLKQLDGLMIELLDNNDFETMKITDRGHEIINEISDYAEQNSAFQEHKEEGKEITSGLTAQEVFRTMLDRIWLSPTSLHMYASVLLMMPFARQKLREEGIAEESSAIPRAE